MTENLYDVLGIPPTATEKEIKWAYRKLAGVHHPDKGGDPEMFQKVQHAYDTLIDPAKRTVYDETGQDGDSSRFSDGVIALFDEILLSGLLPEEWEYIDIFEKMRRHVKVAITTHRKQIKTNKDRVTNLNKVSKRISHAHQKRTVFHEHLAAKVEQAKAAIEESKAQIETCKMVLTFLKEYSFEVSKEKEGIGELSRILGRDFCTVAGTHSVLGNLGRKVSHD